MVSKYWKFWLTLRVSRLMRFSRSSGSALRQFNRASRTFKAVKCEVELGRNTSLLEFTESFFRFMSSNPIVSGSLLSLLKFAFSSSKALLGQNSSQHATCKHVKIMNHVIINMNKF